MSCILLIDDDETIRSSLRLTLEQFGHSVVEARNGLEALAQLGTAPFALALVDIIMPERDGFETIILLRQKAPALKIIAMSGGGRMSSDDYLGIARRRGANRVLQKPFAVGELRAAIEGLTS
jgi:CheY-like chemotaxis protein